MQGLVGARQERMVAAAREAIAAPRRG